ncbi:MAG: hypothetical protein ACTSYN_01585 [Candidatus Heimdallarchaeaceae archaeon]
MTLKEKSIIFTDTCVECGGKIILHNGEYKCSNCGLVYDVEVKMDEFLIFKRNTDNEIFYNDTVSNLSSSEDLGSFIGYSNQKLFYDFLGRPLSEKQQQKFKRLKFIYELNFSSAVLRNPDKAISILNRVAALLRVSKKMRNRAVYFYKSIRNKAKYLNEFRSHVRLIAACLLLAYREKRIKAPFSLHELVSTFNSLGYSFSKKHVLVDVSKLIKILGIRFYAMKSEQYFENMLNKLKTSKYFLKKLQNEHISTEEYFKMMYDIGVKLLERTKNDRGGRNPYIFAAAVVYASERKLAKIQKRSTLLTQKETGEILNIPSHSIRDHFSFLKPYLDQILETKM